MTIQALAVQLVESADARAPRKERRSPRYRKRWWRDIPSDGEMFADECPDISLDGLEEVTVQTPMLAQS